MPSILVAAEALRRDGLRAAGSPAVLGLARRMQVSVWEVLARAARALRRKRLPAPPASALMPPAAREAFGDLHHPWVESGEVSPARRLQIRALVNAQLFRGESRRGRAGPLIYPLLAQPVAELCLAIPIPALAGGEQDRPFARAAFVDRLPELVRRRRSKGSLTSFYARWTAASAGTLGPFLRDSVLADVGLIDGEAVARALEPEQLMRAPDPAALLNAAAVEAWVRYWQGRVPDSEAAPRAGRAA